MQSRRTLAGIEIFAGLSAEEREALEAACRWRRYRLGETLFDRGSDGREVYFVVEGAVNVVSFSRTGREIGFSTAGAGDLVGEMAAIDKRPRSASIVASEDSLVAVLPPEPFVALLKRNGDITFTLLERLSSKVREAADQMTELSGTDDLSRMCAALLRMASLDESVENLWVVSPAPDLRTLSREAGISREAANRSLRELYDAGIVQRKADRLYLMDRDALQRVVDGV